MRTGFRRHSNEARFGNRGEELARRWLKELGYFVLPASLIENGGAPLLESEVENYILPDIIAARNGESILIDVKSKARRPRYQVYGRIQTGCALRHYENYLAVGKATGMRAALCFIHCDDPEMYIGFLDEVSEDAQRWYWSEDWAKAHPRHAYTESMIFFNIDKNHGTKFHVCRIKEDFLWLKLRAESLPPKTVRPWEDKTPRRPGQMSFPGW